MMNTQSSKRQRRTKALIDKAIQERWVIRYNDIEQFYFILKLAEDVVGEVRDSNGHTTYVKDYVSHRRVGIRFPPPRINIYHWMLQSCEVTDKRITFEEFIAHLVNALKEGGE